MMIDLHKIFLWVIAMPSAIAMWGTFAGVMDNIETVKYILQFLLVVDPETGLTGTEVLEAMINDWKDSRYE